MLDGNGISFNAAELDIILEPSDFYETLIENIKFANEQIYITSLYIGNGQKETVLYEEIGNFLSRGGKATIIVDWNRGQRGKKNSTIGKLRKFVELYPDTFKLKLFKSPLNDDGYIVKNIVQMNETLSTQHTKIYACDNRLILSGANLSTDYFTNRQDRYYHFTNKVLVEFFSNVAELISNYSYNVQIDCINDFHEIEYDLFADHVAQLFATISGKSSEKFDSIFYPNIQAGWADIDMESKMTTQCINSLGVDDKLYFCSGYFNPPSPLIHAISSSDCLVELLSADREANGFNGAGFPKSGITPAYQLFADHMLSHIKDKQLNLQEWNREKWTFHAKGLWFYKDDQCIGTTIGSSNFSCRSYSKDLEAGGVILTKNIELQKTLNLEKNRIWKYATPRTILPIPRWVKFSLTNFPKLRAFF